MKKLVPVFLLFILVNFGCKSDPASPTSNNVLMPLKVGNSWVYEHKLYSSNGSVSYTQLDTITLVSTQVLGGISYFTSNYGMSYYYDSQGLWGTINNVHHFFAKYPLAPGELMPADTIVITKESSPDPLDEAIGTTRLTAENVSKLLSSNFICQVYQQDYHGVHKDTIYFSEQRYYQLNTGLVLSLAYANDSTGKSYLSELIELKSWTLK